MHISVLGVGSRLATGPAVELVQTAFARELADQLALFKGMSLADLAHTVMLIEAGVIPSADGASFFCGMARRRACASRVNDYRLPHHCALVLAGLC